MVKNKQFLLWTILATIWLSGCSIINPTPSPAIDVYTLSQLMETSTAPTRMKDAKAMILELSPIRSPQGLLGTGIVYRDMDYGFNSYAYSRWSDNPSKLLSSYLQQSLDQSPLISAVVQVGTRANADLVLESTLVDFSHHLQADETKTTGVVSVIFYLIDPTDKKLIASKQFTKEVIADQSNAKQATMAINKASKLMVNDLQMWLEQAIRNLPEK
ncbi:hypothetical protein LCGC14_0774370 [marine sediment metagenome]|uniref:ABC-type transport auxiliary lipoprotein component domain-containing protein n=1 Tax=marine sediment metagenome TaxID=412755 RepID=A0A0F9PXL6_9ZZZZ